MKGLLCLRNIWGDQLMPPGMTALTEVRSGPFISFTTKVRVWSPVVKFSAIISTNFTPFVFTLYVVVRNVFKFKTRRKHLTFCNEFWSKSIATSTSIAVLRVFSAIFSLHKIPARPTTFITFNTVVVNVVKS